MEILNLGGSFEPSGRPSKKKFKVVLGIGLLAGVLGMGSTLAATISLGTGANVEFGQGISATTACDPEVTVTPTSTFVNADGTTGDFQLSGIKISGIDSTSIDAVSGLGCGTQTFVLHAYTDDAGKATNYAVGASSVNPLYLGWHYTSAVTGGVSGSGYIGFNSGIAVTVLTEDGACTIKATGHTSGSSSDVSGWTCAQTGSGTAAIINIKIGGGATSNATTGAKWGVSTSAIAKLTLESGSEAPAGYATTAISA